MDSNYSSSSSYHNLRIKNDNIIEVGLDIGGSLTKIAISISKEYPELVNKLKEELEFSEQIELEKNMILFKLIQTVKFDSEGRDLLKSKIFLFKVLS